MGAERHESGFKTKNEVSRDTGVDVECVQRDEQEKYGVAGGE